MRFLMCLCVVLSLATLARAGEPRYTVSNCCPNGYVVTNRVAARPACVCGDSCPCPAGVCPACPTAADVLTIRGVPHSRGADGVYRPTASHAEPQMTLVCEGGRCKWVAAGDRAAAPALTATYTAPPAHGFATGGCANGQCGSPQSLGRQPRFAFPRR